MGIKQSVVIRSEYTNNARSAPGRGSRGASPGQYVMRYMAREDATEVLSPFSIASGETNTTYNSDSFTRYMARSAATEQLKSKEDEWLQDADDFGSPLVLKHKFKQIDQLSGRAFGTKGISLSHEDLKESSNVIQKAFDDGHSVQKIIISFEEDYLKETGVLDSTFQYKGRGSYKGHIDQLKLRRAITQGVDRMTAAGQFNDPMWVGTIQFDTGNIHAHIALVDTKFSAYRMKEDGADRGKINEHEKRTFRKGLHYSLEDMRDLKSFHQQASLERQGVVAFVKDYAYSTLRENSTMQLLIASLPKDRNAWRYRTNRISMKYPNELAKQIVERVFQVDSNRSGYDQAMDAVQRYTDESALKNKLSDAEKRKVIEKGRNQIIERSVNGLYKTIKAINPLDFQTRTTMIDLQSSSDSELAQAVKVSNSSLFDPAAFTLRVRGYSERREIHTKQAESFYRVIEQYETAAESGLVDDTAHVMRLFYEEEIRYHMGLSDKYRTFLSFRPDVDVQMVDQMRPVYNDLVHRYGELKQNAAPSSVSSYKKDLLRYTFDCFKKGVASVKEWASIIRYGRDSSRVETGLVLPVRPKTKVENLNSQHFNRVKALDVHHLGLDYYNRPDARIDSKNALVFANVWQSRQQRAVAARVYVNATEQQLPLLDVAESDIESMSPVVDKAIKQGLIHTVTIDDFENIQDRQLYTLSADRSVDVAKEVREVLLHIEMDENVLD